MPRLISIRLVAEDMVTAGTFADYLGGLTVIVFDASFDDPGADTPAAEIGSAAYIAPTVPIDLSPTGAPQHDVDTRIVQHFGAHPTNPLAGDVMFSVATALIEVPDGTPAAEHETVDLRITLERGGVTIEHKRRYFNVPMRNGSLPGDPADYPGLTLDGAPFVSLYLYLPVPGLETGGTLNVPEDGTAPNYDLLLAAVEAVLNDDPGNTDDIALMSTIQARHVANEIVWDRAARPLPAPNAPLDHIYTEPFGAGGDLERARTTFEGGLKTYQVSNDSTAERLANFVFALSAALRIAEMVVQPPEGDAAALPVPVDPDSPEATTRIKLTGIAATAPFEVPPAYVYALTAVLPLQVTAEQRLSMVLLSDAASTVSTLEEALHNDIIAEDPAIGIHQAARRLVALGGARENGLAACPIPAGSAGQDLVTGWLGFAGPEIAGIWTGMNAAEEAGHFEVVLCAVTRDHAPLITALTSAPPPTVITVVELAALPDEDWRAMFRADPSLLPPFTHPGSVDEQIRTFLRHLRRFFDASAALTAPAPAAPGALPLLDPPSDDLVTALAGLVPGLDLETFDPDMNGPALDALFPDDATGRSGFVAWLGCLQAVLGLAAGIAPDELRLSVAEALWARGFIRPSDLDGLDLETFTEALVATVAHAHAATIFANAQAEGASPSEPVGPFAPVNLWGALANCIPPCHVSPLGPMAYLKELLQVRESATCHAPLPDDDSITLGAALSGRRGAIGDLLASHSNACVSLPLIDIVNESLERMVAAAGTPGAIRTTHRGMLGGHVLDTNPSPAAGAVIHDAETLFGALPEHSTPSTSTAEQAAWDTLASDFSACPLPYNQPVDIARTYLSALGTSRYSTMRTFTREIHDFVLNPDNPPAGFRSHLWRYPVRLPIALEYLCITPQEYAVLYSPGALGPAALPGHYGFPAIPDVEPDAWMTQVRILSVFLERTCLDYCEFRELLLSGFVTMELRHRQRDVLPLCEPCCLEEHLIFFPDDGGDFFGALKRLSVFIRLWRRLQTMADTAYSFAELSDIADVLTLFNGNTANGDFVRQLAAFQMLRDDFDLALRDPEDPPSAAAGGASRTHLLSIWVPGEAKFDWALDHLLAQIQQYAIGRYHCPCRPPEFLKILRRNLEPLSRLAGFDPDTLGQEWHAHPTHTLRMAEILAKIYASDFGVGEILFLFTTDRQLQGGDPFPAQTDNEARDLSFDLPDNEVENSLLALREKLRAVEVDVAEAGRWSWSRMGATLIGGYGLPEGDARWVDLGTHFFPEVLEAEGEIVPPAARVWREALVSGNTSEAMWNTPEGPFRYVASAQELETALPLLDAEVIAKLARIRQLNFQEQVAVRRLYMAPRELLAFFSFLFENQRAAERALLEEPDPARRWTWFQANFARFHARSQAIAEHMSRHLERVTGGAKPNGKETALLLLRHLWADENTATQPWEDDTGAVPPVKWGPRPYGGAFHALHGVVGTGLVAEYRGASGLVRWRETHGGLEAFGAAENAANGPLPTLIPAMDTMLTPEQLDYVAIRNGFALGNERGTPVGGAEPFTVTWRGLLLIETGGRYGFRAGAPQPGSDHPDFEALRRFHRWRVRLQQGQKSWILLAHDWPAEEAPADCAGPVHLERGFYDITIEFERFPLVFDGPEDVCPQETGFQIKYQGPDSDDGWATIPHDKLFIGTGERLDDDLNTGTTPAGAFGVLAMRHVVSMRAMRRTLQRLFKAMLFSDRLSLGARPISDSGQSELGYLLSQPQAFSGQSQFDPGGGFQTHRADFDFNLLPVLDNYHPPAPADDSRAGPSPQRMAALFDWWERLFDYTAMRAETSQSPEAPAWFTFHEAAEAHVDAPAQLLRHIGVNIRHVSLVLRHYDPGLVPPAFDVTNADLVDERWTVRVWRADLWLDALRAAFLEADIDMAEPHLWASEGPEMAGLENLTRFYRDGTIENGDPRRYPEIAAPNDGLRLRGRAALVAWLTAMNRVPLPWGGFAGTPRDLSDLILQDVEAGLCQKATRVEEAITALQLFADRARLGLEAGFVPGAGFAHAWDRRFGDFRTWQACKRREIYRENWIGWTEEAVAQGSEAFRFLQSELRRSDLTVPGGGVHWPPEDLPPHQALTLLQKREPATMARLGPPRQGLDVMGTPDRHARPNWLAPIASAGRGRPPGDGDGNGNDDGDDIIIGIRNNHGRAAAATDAGGEVPLWFEAAVRTGRRFLRVAAASLTPASAGYQAKCGAPGPNWCCRDCGRDHPPVMNEYYFWLDVSEEYFHVEQEADWVPGAVLEPGAVMPLDGTASPIPDTVWHDETTLPAALAWAARRIARLNWCRVHNGEFQHPRRSTEGVLLRADLEADQPDIAFRGRVADSLFFDVEGGEARIGYPADPLPGFRYDIAPDTATPLPELQAAEVPELPGGLPAFPWFAFAEPGAPILPVKGFGIVISVAQHLAANCRYEDALKWLELEFPPLQGDNIWAKCDRVPMAVPIPPDDETPPDDNIPPGNNPDRPVPVPVPVLLPPRHVERPGECCCPSAPVSDTRAERRHVMMLYAEILLAWAEALLRKATPEAFQRARMLADAARRILGALPKTVIEKPSDAPAVPVRDVALACAPLNPRLMCLYTLAEDVEGLIHTCLDAQRQKPCGERPYFGEDIVRQCWRMAGDPCLDAGQWCRRRSPQRFQVLVERARRAAAECSALGKQLLTAFQHGDAEFLAQINAKRQRQVDDLILEIRQDQVRASDWEAQALRKSKEAAITNLTYYQNLIAAGLLSGESQYEPLTGTSTGLRAAGNVVEAIGQAMNLIPDPNVGFPTNFVTLPPGKKLAMIFSSAGTVVNVAADIVNTVASLGLTKDGWERREDEWAHNVDLYRIQVEQVEREILSAERRRDAALRDLNVQRQTMANTAELHDFLRDRFTSHELFLWLQKETAALHARCHELALQCAWDAEQAFNFERELSAERFIALDPPDSLHERLLDGDRLSLELARMQKAYEDRDRRPYELTKYISLRQQFPSAFLQLVTTGRCVVELPEWLFDLDHPGHYLRRIRALSVSLPCVVGPYTGVHCKVTLMASSIRISPEVVAPEHRCCDDQGCNSGYEPRPDDPRVVHLHAAAEAIATSTGQDDSGLFQLDFADPRYLPFEYQGTVCRLCIELPHETNRFDIDTLSDFVLHLRYTAHEGGDQLRQSALDCARRRLPGAGTCFIDARREIPGQWRRMRAPSRHGKGAEAQSDYLGLHLNRGMFPFLTGNRRPRATRIEVLFEAPGAGPSRHHNVILFAGERVESIRPDTCREGVFTIDCVSDAAWPGFFHGLLEIDPVEIEGRGGTALGVLAFDPEIPRLCNVWLLFAYEATDVMTSCPMPLPETAPCK